MLCFDSSALYVTRNEGGLHSLHNRRWRRGDGMQKGLRPSCDPWILMVASGAAHLGLGADQGTCAAWEGWDVRHGNIHMRACADKSNRSRPGRLGYEMSTAAW